MTARFDFIVEEQALRLARISRPLSFEAKSSGARQPADRTEQRSPLSNGYLGVVLSLAVIVSLGMVNPNKANRAICLLNPEGELVCEGMI